MQRLKDQGNDAFKKGDYADAIKCYSAALDQEANASDITRFHCYLNRALSRLKLEQFAPALSDADAALLIQPASCKALYRRALALNGVGQGDKALPILIELCKNDPGEANLYRSLIHSIRQDHSNAYKLASITMTISDDKLMKHNLSKIASLLSQNPDQIQNLSSHEQFLSFLLDHAANNCMDAAATDGRNTTDLYLNLLIQIIEGWKSTIDAIEPKKISALVTRSGFQSSWMSLLTAIVKSTPDRDIAKTLIKALCDGLESEFQRDSFDVDCCNRILCSASDIAMSSPELTSQIRSTMLMSILRAPKHARSALDLMKIIAILSECNLNTDKSGESSSDSDSVQLAAPSTEFLTMVQASISDLMKTSEMMKTSETMSSALSALVLVLTAVPAAISSLLSESERLSTVLEIASGDSELKPDAAAVLALASSDASIRAAISESEYSFVFIDALDSTDPLAVAYACLALSKLAICDEPVQSDILESHVVLRTACDMLNCSDSFGPTIIHVLMEALMYLAMFVQTKSALANQPDLMSKFIQSIKSASHDPSLRYAIAQIIATLSTSVEDIRFESELDSEKAKLKEVASKGIPGLKKKFDMSLVAGSSHEVDRVKLALLECGVGRVISDLVISNVIQHRSESLDQAVAKAFARLSAVPSHCGRLVSEGALTALLKIIQQSDVPRPPNVLYDSRLSIARLCIRTNPGLIGGRTQSALANVCLTLIEEAKHELHEYEGLLALTNVASVDEESRNQIMGLKGWQRLLACLSSSNELIQTAALEALVNLIPSQSTMDRLLKQKGAAEQDIKIFLMFSRASEDERTASAALAGLAMMSNEPQLARMIVDLGGIDVALQLSKLQGHKDIQTRASFLLDNLQKVHR